MFMNHLPGCFELLDNGVAEYIDFQVEQTVGMTMSRLHTALLNLAS